MLGRNVFAYRLMSAALTAAMVLALAGVSPAASVTWDGNGAAPLGGVGTWDTSSANWWTGSVYQVWNNANFDDAVFDTAGGTVTLNTGITARNLTFNTTGYTVTGNTLTLGGTTPTVTVNASAAISSILAGSAGLTVAGTGTLTLSGANIYTGLTDIVGGRLQISTNGGLGDAGAGTIVRSGAQLRLSGAGLTTAEPITLYGTGPGNDGALYVQNAGTKTVTGLVQTGSDTWIHVDDPGSPRLLLAGGLAMNHKITVATDGTGEYLEIATTPITGTGELRKEGNGRIEAKVASPGYSGLVRVYDGYVEALATNSLGTGQIIAENDGTLLLRNGITLPNDIVMNCDGEGTAGAIRNENGTNTLTGALSSTNNSSRIHANSGQLNLTNTLTLTNNLGVYGGGTVNVTGQVTGAGLLGKYDAGTLLLSGANNYTGGTTVSGGTLTYLNTAARPASGTTTVSAGATLGLGVGGAGYFNSADLDNAFANTLSLVSLNATSVVGIDTTAGNFVYGSNISGTRGLNKLGANALTLSGNNSHSGGTTLTAGTLNLGSPTAIGTGALTITGGTLDNTSGAAMTLPDNNAQNWNGSFTFAGTNDLNLGTGALTMNGNYTVTVSAGNLTAGGAYNNPSRTLTKAGAGTLTLSGAGALTTLTVNGGVVDLGAGSLTLANAGSSTVGGTGGTINATGGGKIILNSGSAYNWQDWSGALTINAVIDDGANTYGIDINGGSLTLTADNTFKGAVDIQANVALTVPKIGMSGAPSPLGRNSNIVVGNGGSAGTLKYTGTGETTDKVIELHGTTSGGTIDQSGTGLLKFTSDMSVTAAGAKTFTLQGSTAGSGEFAGAIVNSASGATAVTKAGTGLWTLSGINTYTGTTTINAGTLRVLNTAGLSTSAVTLNGGVLELLNNGAGNNGTITYANSLTTNSGNTAGVHVGNNGANTGNTIALTSYNLGNATLNVTGANGYKLSIPTFTLGGGSTGTAVLNPTTADLILGTVTNTSAAHTLQLDGTSTGNQITGVISNGAGTMTVTKTGVGTWTLTGANTYTGTTTVGNGTLVLSGNRTANSGAITVGNATGLTGTLNLENGTYTVGGDLRASDGTGAVGIINQTGGSLTLSANQLLVGAGTSTGTYNLSAGSLTGAASANRGLIIGTNTGSTGTFNLSGTGVLNMGSSQLQVSRSESTAATGATGTYNQTGGSATFGSLGIGGLNTNNNNNSGTFKVTGGTFSAASFTALSGGNNSVSTMLIGGSADVTLPAFPTARGTGATATLTLDGGTLRPHAASTAYMGGLTHAYLTANGAVFNVPSGKDITIGQPFEDAPAQAGVLTKRGDGRLTLSGAHTYSGATIISQGTLQLQSAPPVSGYAAWFDASNPANLSLNGSQVLSWTSSGSKGGTATATASGTGSVTYVSNALNGLGAVRLNSTSGNSNAYLTWSAQDASIRTVFDVFKGASFLLTDSGAYHFHRPTDNNAASPLWDTGNSSANIRSGSTYVNGTLVNGTTYAMPTGSNNGFNLVEVLTAGVVTANSFNRDRTSHSGDQQHGEVIVYDFLLSEPERQLVEAYLNYKWFGIGTPPPSNILPSTTAVQIDTGATLDMNGLSQTIGSLSGAAGSSVLLGTGTLTTGGNDGQTSFAGILSGVGGSLVKTGAGTMTLTGTSLNTYTGSTAVNQGTLLVNGSIASSSGVSVADGATLGGWGNVPVISGAGLVSPGTSPGILTAAGVNPAGGLDFAFEFTGLSPDYGTPSASINDVLRLTGGAGAFASPLTADNQLALYFDLPLLAGGEIFTGGFFLEGFSGDLLAQIAAADLVFYITGDGLGTHLFNDKKYYLLEDFSVDYGFQVGVASIVGGNFQGEVLALTATVPEPATMALLGLAACGLGGYVRRRRGA